METRGITLDQLYNYLEGKFAYIDQRLDNIEKRLDLVEYRLDLIERRLDRLEDKVQAIYDTRDKIKLDFNRRILLGNSLLAGVVAFIVAMFTGKYEMN